jgi:hypothetical protein
MCRASFLPLVSAAVLAASVLACGEPLEPASDQAMLAARGGAALDAPAGLSPTGRTARSIDLAWQDRSSREDGFELSRSTTGPDGAFAVLGTAGANVGGYIDLGLIPLTEYCYKVRAFRTIGNRITYSDFSNTACVSTFGPPPGASNVNATPLSSWDVAVAWTDNATDESGFRVERSLGSGAWNVIATLGPNATRSDFTVASEQEACFRVVAFNQHGDGAASNTDCTTPPAAPSGLTATVVDNQTVDLAWVDNSAVDEGYEIERSWAGGAFIVIAIVQPGSSSYRDGTVTSDTRVDYRVRARKDGGYSSFSNGISVFIATAPPSPPVYPWAYPGSSSVVYLSWQAGSEGTDGFRVERSTDGGASWVTAGATGGLYETLFGEDGRTSEQQVCYRVFAVNRFGESAPSDQACTTPPAGPTNLTATTIDEGTLELTWQDNSAVEDGYQVWYCDYYWGYCDVWTYLPADAMSLQVWVGYSYFVVAVKDGGYSDWAGPVP